MSFDNLQIKGSPLDLTSARVIKSDFPVFVFENVIENTLKDIQRVEVKEERNGCPHDSAVEHGGIDDKPERELYEDNLIVLSPSMPNHRIVEDDEELNKDRQTLANIRKERA